MMSESDKELLELAAKAAGIKLHHWVDKGCWQDEPDEEGFQTAPPDLSRWNPLTSDGDALRLAVKLDIDIDFFSTTIHANDEVESLNMHDNHYIATRRAIVRAAAEIGKQA
jgi:hypothetical protein